MVLADVNVLVHAFRKDSTDHARCRTWLEAVVNGDSRFGVSPEVLGGMVRVVTHPRVFVHPSGLDEALAYADLLLGLPHAMVVQPGDAHWRIFRRLCLESDTRGNMVPDAWFAALAIESRCEWITLDRDYARFSGLRWRLPD